MELGHQVDGDPDGPLPSGQDLLRYRLRNVLPYRC